jgi:hypothetical protein
MYLKTIRRLAWGDLMMLLHVFVSFVIIKIHSCILTDSLGQAPRKWPRLCSHIEKTTKIDLDVVRCMYIILVENSNFWPLSWPLPSPAGRERPMASGGCPSLSSERCINLFRYMMALRNPGSDVICTRDVTGSPILRSVQRPARTKTPI